MALTLLKQNPGLVEQTSMFHTSIAVRCIVNMPPTAKRTRILAKAQSKTGCFTCKARKVRCDEAKPHCARCIKANFQCEGYPTRDETPARTPPYASDTSNTMFQPALPEQTSFLSGRPHGYTMKDAVLLLCRGGPFDIGSAILSQVLSGTAILWPSAVAALRVLETLTGLTSSGKPVDEATRIQINTDYGEAVRLLSSEIAQRQLDATTVVITCIILTAVEVLSRRRQNALKHFTAALALSRGQITHTSIFTRFACLFKIYDLQILLYSDGVCLPNVHAISLSQLGPIPKLEEDHQLFEHYVVNLLHCIRCLFAQLNNQVLLEGLDEISVFDKRTYVKHILLMNQRIIEAMANGLANAPKRSLLMLQNLCLMTLVELEQIDSYDETSWDDHMENFQIIVENTEKVLAGTPFSHKNHNAPAFTLQLGPIPPVRLVAFKCRHPVLRRRAINCLNRSGIEGPFVGTLIAALSRRCMEIEEGSAGIQETWNNGKNWQSLHQEEIAEGIPEACRITKCCIIEANGEADGNPSPLSSVGRTHIKLLQRKRPCLSIEAGMISSSYFQIDPQFEDLRHRKLDPAKWEMWTETLVFGGSQE